MRNEDGVVLVVRWNMGKEDGGGRDAQARPGRSLHYCPARPLVVHVTSPDLTLL